MPALQRVLMLAVVLVAMLALPGPAGAGPISYSTLFQDPGVPPVQDPRIEQRALDLIAATPAGGRITFAFRDFNRRGIADALIAARLRGVEVDGVIDGGERNRAVVKDLVAALGPDRVVVCGTPPDFALRSCIAAGPEPSLMHNKFMTFSELADGRTHVVLQTSMNFFFPSQYTTYNDAIEVTGDQPLHDAYVAYLFQLKGQVRTGDNFLIRPAADARNTFFTSPRSQADRDHDDTIVDRMDEIDCAVGGAPDGRGLIRIANLHFRTERAVILRKLLDLQRQGCDIAVISTQIDGDILAGLAAHGIPVRPFLLRELEGVRPEVIVHHKFWTVDAGSSVFGGRRQVVYAGSSNWRADEQYSDDLLLRVADDAVYADYLAAWERLWERAESDPPPAVAGADLLAPATALAAVPRANDAGWHRAPVTVRVAASDGQTRTGATSGVQVVHLAASGAAAEDVPGATGPITVLERPVLAEGVTTLSASADDHAGNLGAPASLAVRLDRTDPVLTGLPRRRCVLWPPNRRLVRVARLAATDALSGLAGPLAIDVWSTAADDSGDIAVRGGVVWLRAERAKRGKRRVYTIAAAAADVAGNAVTRTATCVVPGRRR
jgi:hypothetical protein